MKWICAKCNAILYMSPRGVKHILKDRFGTIVTKEVIANSIEYSTTGGNNERQE